MSALEDVRELAEAVARRRHLTLWDVEMGGQPGRSVVRVYVDADGGVDLDTVAEVSEEISRGLDLRDPIAGRYTLEVSSPGLERSLRYPEHFSAVVGARVMVKTKEILHGNGHRLDGELVATNGEACTVQVAGEKVRVPYDAIKTARTVFEWD